MKETEGLGHPSLFPLCSRPHLGQPPPLGTEVAPPLSPEALDQPSTCPAAAEMYLLSPHGMEVYGKLLRLLGSSGWSKPAQGVKAASPSVSSVCAEEPGKLHFTRDNTLERRHLRRHNLPAGMRMEKATGRKTVSNYPPPLLASHACRRVNHGSLLTTEGLAAE